MSGFPDFITARSKVWITTFVPIDWTGERKVWQSSKVKSLDYIINVTDTYSKIIIYRNILYVCACTRTLS